MSDPEVSSKRLTKFPAFDGFRGVAVLVVVFSHLPQVVDSDIYNVAWKLNQAPRAGYVALDIFFAISGFFITRLLLRERAKTGRISFSNFYGRRALRLCPGLLYGRGLLLLRFSFWGVGYAQSAILHIEFLPPVSSLRRIRSSKHGRSPSRSCFISFGRCWSCWYRSAC